MDRRYRYKKLKKNAFGLYEKSFSVMKGQPPKEKAVAFCSCNTHRGWLSLKMMREHGCLGKQCPFLKQRKEHPYWEERAKSKERRRLKKLEEA